MKKALQTHKANLKARQESFSMRERPKPQANREESPLFEPEHIAPPITLEPRHDNGVEIRPAPLRTPPVSLLAEQTPAANPTEATRKRKSKHCSFYTNMS